MTRPINLKELEGDIPTKLHIELTDWISTHKDVKIRQCMQAMVELFLSIPEEIQAILLVCPRESKIFITSLQKLISLQEEQIKVVLKPYVIDFFEEYRLKGLDRDLVLDAMIVAFDKISLKFRIDCIMQAIKETGELRKLKQKKKSKK